jgi:hypothetical protein
MSLDRQRALVVQSTVRYLAKLDFAPDLIKVRSKKNMKVYFDYSTCWHCDMCKVKLYTTVKTKTGCRYLFKKETNGGI